MKKRVWKVKRRRNRGKQPSLLLSGGRRGLSSICLCHPSPSISNHGMHFFPYLPSDLAFTTSMPCCIISCSLLSLIFLHLSLLLLLPCYPKQKEKAFLTWAALEGGSEECLCLLVAPCLTCLLCLSLSVSDGDGGGGGWDAH